MKLNSKLFFPKVINNFLTRLLSNLLTDLCRLVDQTHKPCTQKGLKRGMVSECLFLHQYMFWCLVDQFTIISF